MLTIGNVVKLKTELLGNEPGTLGIVYDEYEFHGRNESWKGVSIIFTNGEYDGFSEEEQELFLEFVEHKHDFRYQFSNVMKLSRDFEAGFFEPFIGKKTEPHVREFPDWQTERCQDKCG